MAGSFELIPGGALSGGRYRVQRRLAAGGMASVWLARDERLDREVAVKVISDVLATDPRYVERFRREARMAAALSHPHLVQVFDFSEEGERPYLVMEYVEGGSLADALRGSDGDVIEPGSVARPLLEALAAIHEAGIVHRDIKPGNVLIGANGQIKLTDFGIARPDDATSLTQTGHVVGTARYLAPELARGEPATAQSDLYACGVLLGECARGDQPPWLARFVERLTASDPRQRPSSARQALELLGDRTRTAPTRVLPSTARSPTTTPTAVLGDAPAGHLDRRKAAVAGALAAGMLTLLVLVLGNGGGTKPQTAGSPPATRSPTTNPPSRSTTVGTPGPSAPSAPAPSQAATSPSGDTCATIEQRRARIEEQKRTIEAQKHATNDKSTRDALEARKRALDQQRHALDEHKKACH
jgi:serine/threonine protein kinase